MKSKLLVCLIYLSLSSLPVFAAQPTYVGNLGDNALWSIDTATGAPTFITEVAPGSGAGLIQFALWSPTIGYGLSLGNQTIYRIDVSTGEYSPFSSMPQPGQGLAIANQSTAYLGAGGNVYSLNLETGATHLITPSPVSGTMFISSLAVRNNTAYVVGYIDKKMYAVELQTGASRLITPLDIDNGNAGIALGRNTAYVTDPYVNQIHSVDLRTGASTLLTTVASAGQIIGIQLINNETAYVVDTDNDVYAVNLITGAYAAINPVPVPGTTGFNNGLFSIGIFPQLSTGGLTGNNRILADYLNQNSPLTTSLLYLLTEAELKDALEAIAPTRNSFATFASQNGVLASIQVLADHLHRRQVVQRSGGVSQRPLAENSLMADASEICFSRKRPAALEVLPDTEAQEPKAPAKCSSYTGWLGIFGEYGHEKAQKQTPAFSGSLGGFLAGMDYNTASGNIVGCGGSYIHTHVHQENGRGDANVDQGFLILYGSLRTADWVFDLGLWGGYYHVSNNRKIYISPSNFENYPVFDQTAKSNTQGGQLGPHFEVSCDRYVSLASSPRFGVVPFLMADWVANWEQSFQEHGAAGYNMYQEGKFCSLLRGEIGLRFNETATVSWGDLIFQQKGSYAFQQMFGTGTATAFLVGSPGQFTVSTLTDTQNLGVFEFSMLFEPNNPRTPYANLRYQGEFGSLYQSHQGILEIGYTF